MTAQRYSMACVLSFVLRVCPYRLRRQRMRAQQCSMGGILFISFAILVCPYRLSMPRYTPKAFVALARFGSSFLGRPLLALSLKRSAGVDTREGGELMVVPPPGLA